MLLPSTFLALVVSTWAAALVSRQSEASLPPYNQTSYAPSFIECPSRQQWLRSANGLNPEEAAYVWGRKQKVLDAFEAYIGRLHLEDFDSCEYFSRLHQNLENVPNIAYSLSGGSWASALTGTGPLWAFDDRYAPAVEQRTGGLLQSLTYMGGLSGGSFTTLSIIAHDYPEIEPMVADWHLDLDPLGDVNSRYRVNNTILLEQVAEKYEAGWNISFGDFIGRAVAYEFLPGANGGIGVTVSGLRELSKFQNHEMPMPLWQGVQGTPYTIVDGVEVPSFNATTYEWTPYEFGSWDGPEAFLPMEYLGTKLVDGEVEGDCVVGYDRGSFLMGTVGDGWNYWYLGAITNGSLGTFSKRSPNAVAKRTLQIFPISTIEALEEAYQYIANYTLSEDLYVSVPNPFATKDSVDNLSNPPVNLTLVDETEAASGDPLYGLAQPARKSDFIIAWEDVTDAHPYLWNNGTSLYRAYTYSIARGVPFPIIPPPNTIMNLGLSTRPVFFGCDANLTSTHDLQAPIILYMANTPYSSYTNYTGFQDIFTSEQMHAILDNSWNYVTQANGTLNPEWPECLGCATIDRSLSRVGMQRTAQCERCMSRYCWNGTEDNSTPSDVNPSLVLDPSESFAEWNASAPYWPIET